MPVMIGSIDPPSSEASFKPVIPEGSLSVALDATPDGGSSVPVAAVLQATTGPVTARRLGSGPPIGTAGLGSLSSTPVDAATTCMSTRELRWHAEQHARAARAHALHAHHPSDFAARMHSQPVTSRRSQRALPLSSRGLPLTGHNRSTIHRTPAAQTHRAHRVATDVPLLSTYRQPLPPFSDAARSCRQSGRRRSKQRRDPGPRPGCLVSILDNKNSHAGRCDLTGRFVMWLDCTEMDRQAPENWAAARHRKTAVLGRPMSRCDSRPCTPQYRSSSPKRSSH